jgi:phosphohistidine phosphatase
MPHAGLCLTGTHPLAFTAPVKYLTLIRHAKAGAAGSGVADLDRPLSKRGERDAPQMGRVLARMGLAPDLAISSPARRALATARIVLAEMDYAGEFRTDERIYEADVSDLFSVLREVEDRRAHVCLFGHNPGLHDLVSSLAGDCLDRLATCGVVCLDLPIHGWPHVRPGAGTVREYLCPEMFEPN